MNDNDTAIQALEYAVKNYKQHKNNPMSDTITGK